jgi:hypothetical protein
MAERCWSAIAASLAAEGSTPPADSKMFETTAPGSTACTRIWWPCPADSTSRRRHAEGRFYLLTEPSVRDAMGERADVLASQRPPLLKSR